jgi:hypothetical protein
MGNLGTDSVKDSRTRPPVDDIRPGPTAAVQPAPDRVRAAGRRQHDAGSRSERLRRLRRQIRSGTYDPPLDEVAERMAAFFVMDRRFLSADIETDDT